MENVRDLFITSKQFQAEALNVQGYKLIQISTGKAKKQSFRDKLDIDCDMDMVAEVLENKGRAFAYVRSSRVKALFLSRADGHTYSCNEIFLADEIKDEPIVNLMETQVAFLLAQRASMYSDGKALFMDTLMPKLVVKTGKYNWVMAIFLCLCMAAVYSHGFQDIKGIIAGILIGAAVNFCFTRSWYEYEGVSDTLPQEVTEDTSSAT